MTLSWFMQAALTVSVQSWRKTKLRMRATQLPQAASPDSVEAPRNPMVWKFWNLPSDSTEAEYFPTKEEFSALIFQQTLLKEE